MKGQQGKPNKATTQSRQPKASTTNEGKPCHPTRTPAHTTSTRHQSPHPTPKPYSLACGGGGGSR